MSQFTEIAYAKINLALHIRRKRSDGYHDLETIFAFLDGGDRLAAESADKLTLQISGPFAQGLSASDNLVVDAANLLRSHCGVQGGVKLTLIKNLPIASGIGGGSADAAATLRILNRLWGCGLPVDELANMAAPLGADIPACVYSQTMIGGGTGVNLRRPGNSNVKGLPVLLINPLQEISTADIFARWSGQDDGPIAGGDAMKAALGGRNGLEISAIGLCPVISDILSVLEKTGPLLRRMSGSGATCFAIYESATLRDDAVSKLARHHPEWWAMPGLLR
ncbi:MAG: 4-(cytidine 5'-diphospho)-2-C-methyl-D-erythritol kinase [Sphingorhabdus sp.]